MNHKENTTTKTSMRILEKIQRGEVRKLPAYTFFLRGIFFALAVTASAFLVFFVVSFMFFVVQTSGLWDMSAFGVVGIQVLLLEFPWSILCVCVGVGIVLELLLNHYRFVYRRPLLYSVAVSILVIVFMSVLVGRPLQQKIYRAIEGERWNEMKVLYDRYTSPNPAMFHPGTVAWINAKDFGLEGRDGSVLTVIISSHSKVRPGLDIRVGNRLLVVGVVNDGMIDAEIVNTAPVDGRP